MTNNHARYQCEHATVVRQCRCMGPHRIIIVACPDWCPKNKKEEERAPQPPLGLG